MRNEKLPTDHHYVPQFLLRNFVDGADKLHAYDRRTPNRGVFYAPTFKVFFQKNLYTAVSQQGVRDTSLETGFRPMEHQASILVRSILEIVRQAKVPGLTADMRSFIDAFVYYQWKRVPDSVDRVVSRADLDTIAADTLAEFERDVRPLTDDERKALKDEATWKRIIQNARRDVVARAGGDVLDAFAKMTINFVRITNPKKAFIIGSAPVAKLHPRGDANLSGPATQIWLPIASDVAIAYTGTKPSRYIPVTEAHDIRHINLAVAWGSNLIASRSPLLTSSLSEEAGRKMGTIGL